MISYLMLSRWAIGAYGTILDVNNLVPVEMQTKVLKDMPFPTGVAYEQTWGNLTLNWLILLLHIAVYLGVTGWLQKRKDIL